MKLVSWKASGVEEVENNGETVRVHPGWPAEASGQYKATIAVGQGPDDVRRRGSHTAG